MASQSLDVDSLRKGLETLPQELYDQVYREVFTPPPGVRDLGDVVQTRQDFKLLHISKATRENYANLYYGNAVFEIPAQPHDRGTRLHRWTHRLPESHRKLIHRIILVYDSKYPTFLADVSKTIRPNTFTKWTTIFRSCAYMYPEREAFTSKLFIKVGRRVYGDRAEEDARAEQIRSRALERRLEMK